MRPVSRHSAIRLPRCPAVGLRAAHDAGYRATEAHILADLSFRPASLGDSRDGVALGEAAQRVGSGSAASVQASVMSRLRLRRTDLSPDLLRYGPHGDTVVLGGVAQPSAWSREPDPATAAAILTRCAEVEPRLRKARVLDHRVGLRPTRPDVRVEAEQFDGACVIHNYGHGGAGVTLSWGCATDVAALARATQ